jgi:hypothetical protein
MDKLKVLAALMEAEGSLTTAQLNAASDEEGLAEDSITGADYLAQVAEALAEEERQREASAHSYRHDMLSRRFLGMMPGSY